MPQRCWYGDSATYTPNNVHFNDQQSPFVTLFMPKLHVVVDTSELRSENASMTTSAIVANISTLITISDSTPPPLVPRLPLQKKSHHHNYHHHHYRRHQDHLTFLAAVVGLRGSIALFWMVGAAPRGWCPCSTCLHNVA